MSENNVNNKAKGKVINLAVHPWTYGFLLSQSHMKASVRKASTSAEVSEVLHLWTAGDLELFRKAQPNLPQSIPVPPHRVQVKGYVSPEVYAALTGELASRLKSRASKGGEEPSLNSIAGEVVDAWYFSDYRNLPYREGDRLRKKISRGTA